MKLADLELALSWAKAEGWNPGLDDAKAFLAADPTGFLMGWLNGQPIAAISAVRHSDDYGFLGLYLCQPDFRGQGYGLQIWQAAIALFGSRTIGLDGVVDQQENYAKSGFEFSHNTMRYLGEIPAGPVEGFREISGKQGAAFSLRDSEICGVVRPRYISNWLEGAKTRCSLALSQQGEDVALGTIRQCDAGYKIGPLYARNSDDAKALAQALVARIGAQGAKVSIDAPSHNQAATELCQSLGLEPVFSTARMYKGYKPKTVFPAMEFGVTTLELG